MILAGADEERIRERLQCAGHRTMWHQEAEKIEAGVTSFEEVEQLGMGLPWEYGETTSTGKTENYR